MLGGEDGRPYHRKVDSISITPSGGSNVLLFSHIYDPCGGSVMIMDCFPSSVFP